MRNKGGVARFTLLCFLCGCSRSPSVDVLGSYFPAWIVCCLIGISLTVVMYFILVRVQLEPAIPIKTIVYPCAAAALTFLAWILFYS